MFQRPLLPEIPSLQTTIYILAKHLLYAECIPLDYSNKKSHPHA